MWNMERIRLTASEGMSFENVDGRTDGRRTDGRRIPLYTICYGVRKGSKAAVPVHRYFFTGPPVKFTGGPLNITGAPLYFTGTPLYLPVEC